VPRLPIDLSIPEPCHQPWRAMSGDAAQRHCPSCNKTVHNLASLNQRQIEDLIRASDGPVCARVTRRRDGSVVMAESSPQPLGLSSTFVLASALAAAPVFAQEFAPPRAVVTGTVLTPDHSRYIQPDAPREILFVQNGKTVLTTTSDTRGRFTATVPVGTYDIIFRSGPMWGERVDTVALHAGAQEFSPVRERFDFGHLGEVDQLTQVVTVGELISTLFYPITPRNLLLHPVAVARELGWRQAFTPSVILMEDCKCR
jgi:hypothetical protein